MMEGVVERIVYVREIPDYVKRAKRNYAVSHREVFAQSQKKYIERMEEQDLDAWRAKRAEYSRRYREKIKAKMAQESKT